MKLLNGNGESVPVKGIALEVMEGNGTVSSDNGRFSITKEEEYAEGNEEGEISVCDEETFENHTFEYSEIHEAVREFKRMIGV